jgi:hypothetical protein
VPSSSVALKPGEDPVLKHLGINSPRSTAAVNNSEEKRPAKRHERERHEEIPERLERNENSCFDQK